MQAATVVEQLQTYGPDRCAAVSVEQARGMCRRLVRARYENFSVLSAVVPERLRDDFASVYAFCRWADDLGDEISQPERALELLKWWRGELDECFAGRPRHPVFVALRPTIERHELPSEPFERLIDAFVQDQTVRRYDTWARLIDYCARSANPVGRLVLMMCGEDRSEEAFQPSDDICTALQLTNHWQDVRRDVEERDRIYVPQELSAALERFEERLLGTVRQGFAVDHTFLEESRRLIRACCERTWKLYESGQVLTERVKPVTRPIVWLLSAGGQHVLRMIEMWNCETVLSRPRLSKARRAMLVARAWWMARRAPAAGAAPR